MIWQDYQLGNTVLKALGAVTLWQTEKGMIEISKNTLATPIKLGDQEEGYVFHGHGKLLLDAIVETKEGAMGRSVERELNEPFLMLGDTEETQKHLTEANEEDFETMGYENQKGFEDRAEDLCDQFFKKRGVHNYQRFDEDHGLVFALQNEAGKIEILVAKGCKLVYKAMDIVFVSNENKVVLKSPREVVCTSNGKSFIVKK